MVVTDQSTNLSMLSPSVWVYRPGSKLPAAIGSLASAVFGATVSYSLSGVQAGQTYLIRAMGNSLGDPTGAFGLEVNFGSAIQPPISPPITVVAQQPDQGSGVSFSSPVLPTNSPTITVGGLTGGGAVYSMTTGWNRWRSSGGWLSFGSGAINQNAPIAIATLVASDTAQLNAPAQVPTTSLAVVSVDDAGSPPSGSTLSVLQVLDTAISDWGFLDLMSMFTKGNTTNTSSLC
jgi:hypothetical protein